MPINLQPTDVSSDLENASSVLIVLLDADADQRLRNRALREKAKELNMKPFTPLGPIA